MKNTVTPPPRAILTKFTLFSITIALILTFTACPTDSPPAAGDPAPKTDPALNGTWKSSDATYKFNNGTFERQIASDPDMRGTFTTSGSTLTLTYTHIWGAQVDKDAKWYTKTEIKAANSSATEDQINNTFAPLTLTYAISGNTLTLTENGSPTNYTKQP